MLLAVLGWKCKSLILPFVRNKYYLQYVLVYIFGNLDNGDMHIIKLGHAIEMHNRKQMRRKLCTNGIVFVYELCLAL